MTTMVLFDADCGFCTHSARLLQRWGCTAGVEPLQRADLAGLGVDPVRAERELPAVTSDGVVYGAAAIRVALATGPWWTRALAAVLGFWPVAALADAVYRWVAANRHRLPGGAGSCELEP